MAGGIQLGKAWFMLVPKLDKGATEEASKEAADAVGKGGDSAGNAFGKAMLAGVKKFAAPIAAAVSVVAIKKFASDSISAFTDLAGSTKSLQRVIGGTSEEVSGLAGAMKLSGMDAEAASSCLTIFSKKLEAAAGDAESMAAISDELGTAIFDSSGKIRSMNELLPEIADKFASMPDGVEKTALACQLFGKSGTAMLPFLNKGKAGIEELTAKAKELGIVIDDQALAKFSAYKGAIREWDTALQGAKVTIGASLVPFITMATNALSSLLVPAISGAANAIADFFNGVVGVIQSSGIGGAFEAIGSAFMAAFPSDGGGAAGFGEAVGGAIAGLTPILEAFTPVAQLAGAAIAFLGEHPEAVTVILGIAGAFAAVYAYAQLSTMLHSIASALGITAATAPAASAGMTSLAAGETAAGNAAKVSAGSMLKMGAAVLMIGAGVALASVGMAILAQSAIALASAGPNAAIAMVGMVAAIALLAVGAAALGPALTAGAVGILAFGAAILLVGAGVALACLGISMLANSLPIIAEYGADGAAAMVIVGAAAVAMGALVLVGGALVLAGGALILAGGALVVAGGALFIAGGAMMIAGGAMMIAAGAMAVAFSAMLLAACAGVAALNAVIGDLGNKVGTIGWGFQSVAENGSGAVASLLSMAATAPQVASGFGDISKSSRELGGAFGDASAKAGQFSSALIFQSAMAAAAFLAAINQMQSALKNADLTIQVKLGPLPHFNFNGQFNAETGAVPSIDVAWYRRGGLATGPSVVGVGEAGNEAIVPLNSRVLGEIADGISANGGVGGIDYDRLAYVIARELDGMAVEMDGQALVGQMVSTSMRLGSMNGAR